MNLKDAQQYRISKRPTGKIEHKVKKSVLGVSQHQVIVKTDIATNTGPVQMFNRPITVPYGYLIQWLTKPENQKFEIIRIITIEDKWENQK